jgi:peptidoglycan hydrolase CwlO-like protein
LAAVAFVHPTPSAAQDDPQSQRDQVNDRQAQIEIEIDLLEARSAEIEQAMADLTANVERQQDELAEAERAHDAAVEDVDEATEAVGVAQDAVDELDRQTDQLVVESYINPPGAQAIEAFKAGSMTDAAVTRGILELQADADADLTDQLDAAHEDLEVEQANKEDAAEAAEAAEADASAELDDLQSALTQQQEFSEEVESNIDQRLIEAETLREIDAELAEQIREEQERVAAYLEAVREQQEAAAAAAGSPAPAPPSGGGGSTITSVGELATVSCPNGGSITVAASIGGNIQGLMNDAAAQGVNICGAGYRDPQRQIELREQHCGSSYYAIYEMPSSQCNPPTARPGQSQHELGLAIDFNCNGGGAINPGNECWNFLVAFAERHGLYNFDPEPWHWSTTGR